MHDCPGCQVPLHGHEAFCPVCGFKQQIRPEFRSQADQYKKGFNPIGWILAIFLIGGLLFFAIQNSWIGQLIQRGPAVPAGDSALSPQAAREKLENSVLQNLSGQSNTCKFVYMAEEKSVDRNYAKAVDLTIDVNLKNPSIKKTIVEPVKSLMEPGLINTLVLNDSHSGATITYSLSKAGAEDSADADKENIPPSSSTENQ